MPMKRTRLASAFVLVILAMTIILPVVGTRAAPLHSNPGTSGLVAWWSMDETGGTRYDSHSTNHLTDNNTVGFTMGVQGNAAYFVPANSEYLSVADTPGVSTGNIDFTLVAHVYLNSTASAFTVLDKSDNVPSTNIEYRITHNPSTGFRFRVGTGIVDSGAISPNTWYTVIAWHDSVNDTLNIQLNDEAVNTVSYSGGASDTAYPLTIAAYADGTSVLDGRIDELALYKRVLTPSERYWLHNDGNGRTYSEVLPTATPTNTATHTPTDTPTNTATHTPTDTPTITPTVPTSTPATPAWTLVPEITYGDYAVTLSFAGLCLVVILIALTALGLYVGQRKGKR